MATLYVRKEGNDSNDGSSVALAKLTILSAETDSSNSDTIDIGEGGFEEVITTLNKSITYQGAGKYKTTIVGAISPLNNNTTLSINDLTLVLNQTVGAYIQKTITWNRCRVLGNKLASTRAIWIYGKPIYANYTEFHDLYYLNYLLFGPLGGIQLNHCTLYSTALNQIILSYGSNQATDFIKNCIFYNIHLTGAWHESMTHENNIWYPYTTTGGTDMPFNASESGENPLFVDPPGAVLSVRDDSPAINMGVAE